MITNLNHYKYKKNAVVVSQVLKKDITINNYIHTNRQNLRKEYVKSYMKLLSK
jgi:hypothetical protein